MKLEIRWEQSARVPQFLYGYFGPVRAFTIDTSRKNQLQIWLPGPKGLRSLEFPDSIDAAKAQCERELVAFMGVLAAAAREPSKAP